jgi:lysophospholipase L1-like esterase
MSKLSPSTLKVRQWHGFELKHVRSGAAGTSVLHVVVPALIVLVLVAFRAYLMAAIVGGIAATVILIRQFSVTGRKKIDQGLGVFGHWVGQLIGLLLLGPVFFVGITFIRCLRKLNGSDPLRLRGAESPTFWLPCDDESRRAKYAKSMFCSERLLPGRMQVLPLLVITILLLFIAEVGLRIYGLRDAVVYQSDADIGYYPKPNQRVRHPGRIITINNHGMRAADIADQKAPGQFRILMLGDSTLAGTRVSNDELYSSLLEKKLNEAAGSAKFQVMNMGVNAWGPFHERAFVRKFGTFQADLAIIGGLVYNCYRPLYGLESLPYFPARHPPRLALEHVAYTLLWQYRHRVMGPEHWLEGETAAAQALKGVEAYGEMAEFLQKNNAETMFQMLPGMHTTLGQPVGLTDSAQMLMEKVRGRVKALGIYANLVGPIFKGVTPVKEIYHDGVHFDRLGHRLFAEYLFEQLREHSPRVKKALERP